MVDQISHSSVQGSANNPCNSTNNDHRDNYTVLFVTSDQCANGGCCGYGI